MWEVLRHHPRVLLLGVGVGLAAFVVQSTLTTFVVAHGVQVGHARQTTLDALTLSSALAPAILAIGATAAPPRDFPALFLPGAVAGVPGALLIFPIREVR